MLVKEIYRFYMLEEIFPDKILIIPKYGDILNAKKDRKLGLILNIQGVDALENDFQYATIMHMPPVTKGLQLQIQIIILARCFTSDNVQTQLMNLRSYAEITWARSD